MSILTKIAHYGKSEKSSRPLVISQARAHELWLAMNHNPEAMKFVSLADVDGLEHGETFDLFLIYNKERIVLQEDLTS